MIFGLSDAVRSKRVRCVMYLGCGCVPWGAQAASASLPGPAEVPDSVVQINRVEVWSSPRTQSAATTMAPMQVVARSTAERLGLTSVADVLKQMAGVAVRDYGGLGGMKTISVRNLGAAHTAVSYDGVPVSNCMAGQIDVSRFASDQIEEVRLHVGQVDDLLAPALLSGYAGVLQLRTARPSADWQGRAHLSASDWDTFQESVALQAPIRTTPAGEVRHGLALRGSWRSTSGDYPYTFRNGWDQERLRRQNSHVHSGQAEADWLGRWGQRTETNTKLYYYRTHNELPGGIIYYNTYSREESREENLLAQSRLTTQWGDRWRAVAVLKYNYAWTLHTDPLTVAEWQREVYYQNEAYAQASISYRASQRWTVAVAEDLQWATLRSPRADCPDPLRRSSYTALRLRYEAPSVTLQASGLYTAVRDTKSANHDFCAPSLSAQWHPWAVQPLYLRLLLRRGYRLPSFNDLYYSRVGNRNLRPERADEGNLGVTYRRASRHAEVTLTADYHEQYVHDKIVAVPSTFTWKMLNFERARLHGLDVTAAWRYAYTDGVALRLNAGYMYQRAVDRTSVTRGSQLPYTPRHSGSASLLWDHPWLSLGYTVQWMGERYSTRMNTAHYRLKPFADQGLTLSHTFWRRRSSSGPLMLYATVQNLFDREYEVVQYYPMPGRQWRVGVQWKLAAHKL